jgi:hypothetical protein
MKRLNLTGMALRRCFPKPTHNGSGRKKVLRINTKTAIPKKELSFRSPLRYWSFATDQYHLNNLIHRASMTAALVIKIGEGKRKFKQYVFDALYYTAAYQLGFGGVYYYFKSRVP